MKLFSVVYFAIVLMGIVCLIYGIFNDVWLTIISTVVIILGLFGWYVFKNLNAGFKDEDKNESTGD